MPPIVLSDSIKPGEHVLCAVSGGADSVALLLLLKEKADRGELNLTAAHFDHRIRAASADDAYFVRRCASDWASHSSKAPGCTGTGQEHADGS
jgi:tRNA(Ile)-lysidine synthase